MPAHLRAALTQVLFSVPIIDGVAVFGRSQSLYLFEHRGGAHRRELAPYLMESDPEGTTYPPVASLNRR